MRGTWDWERTGSGWQSLDDSPFSTPPTQHVEPSANSTLNFKSRDRLEKLLRHRVVVYDNQHSTSKVAIGWKN